MRKIIPNSTRTVLMIFIVFLLVPVSCASKGKTEQQDTAGGEHQTTQQSDSGGMNSDKTDSAASEQNRGAGDITSITGIISVKGSEPRTFVALTTVDGTEYKITGHLAIKLKQEYQYKTVVIAGSLTTDAMGPGFPAEFEAAEIIQPK